LPSGALADDDRTLRCVPAKRPDDEPSATDSGIAFSKTSSLLERSSVDAEPTPGLIGLVVKGARQQQGALPPEHLEVAEMLPLEEVGTGVVELDGVRRPDQ
jgi:hypothetical protein